ncbi:hypothetical protein C8F01DRAFT_1132784 [Mycena amicta]|nr:hypothetical protein C8F01DRAFT_1132784 [Mycena amicta]
MRTYIIETTAGCPVFHIPFPISHLDSEHVVFRFRNSGGNPIFYVGPAEVGIENQRDAVDYATVVRAVAQKRMQAKLLVDGVHIKLEEQSPRLSRARRPYTPEETHALARMAFSVATYPQLYEEHRQTFARECAPSLPASRVLTAPEEAECRALWEALLRLDRIFSGPLRDVDALQQRCHEMLEAAARRLSIEPEASTNPQSSHTSSLSHRAVVEPRRIALQPVQSSQPTPSQKAVAAWIKASATPSRVPRNVKENAELANPVASSGVKRRRTAEVPNDDLAPLNDDDVPLKRQRGESLASDASSTVLKDGYRHKTKRTVSSSGEGYTALIPQSALPSGELLTSAERKWLLAQRDLARAPDYWRPVPWLALGERMFQASSKDPDVRPLHHSVLLDAWDRGEWRWPGHESLCPNTRWADWIRRPEGQRWRTGPLDSMTE